MEAQVTELWLPVNSQNGIFQHILRYGDKTAGTVAASHDEYCYLIYISIRYTIPAMVAAPSSSSRLCTLSNVSSAV